MHLPSHKLKAIFMGTPAFAVPPLETLLEKTEVLSVVTNPDRRAGRGRKVQPSPVKQRAMDAGVSVFTPERLSAICEDLSGMEPDVIVVAAYGTILRKRVLKIPRLGCVNVHASLLPALRGAAPIQWAVIRGETRTGITIMQMDEGMDTGPILLQEEEKIQPTDTAGSLSARLSVLGGRLLATALERLKAGTLEGRPQPEEGVSYAPLLTKEQGRVVWDQPARQVAALIRGTDPWPGAYTTCNGRSMKIFNATVCPGEGVPGQVLGLDRGSLVVCCGEGAVALRELQMPGRKRMTAQALCAGTPIPPGTFME